MKKVILYTLAVDGSGDYHAAHKALLELLADKTHDPLAITWIIVTQQEPLIRKISEAQKQEQFSKVNIIQIASDTELPHVLSHLADTDLILVLPNVNQMGNLKPTYFNLFFSLTANKRDSLKTMFSKHCKQAKILSISEYDYNPIGGFFTMGLGKDSLGVLIPAALEKESKDSTELEKNTKLTGFDVDAPFFFAYMNLEKQDNIASYINSILVIAKKEGHERIQIVTNIPMNIIQQCDPEGRIKRFDPFPLQSKDFQVLLHRSHPFALCTGDQSLIEFIFALKNVFYQVMPWKEGLSLALMEFVEEVCGPNALYYQIVEIAINYPGSLPTFLEAHWSLEVIPSLQQDAQKIKDAIMHRKNFSQFLPKLVHLPLMSIEKLVTEEFLEDIDTGIYLSCILEVFKNEDKRLLQLLQSIQHRLKDLVDTFNVFNKILKQLMSLENPEPKVLVFISAMQDKLPDIIKNPGQLEELRKPEPSLRLWEAIKSTLFSEAGKTWWSPAFCEALILNAPSYNHDMEFIKKLVDAEHFPPECFKFYVTCIVPSFEQDLEYIKRLLKHKYCTPDCLYEITRYILAIDGVFNRKTSSEEIKELIQIILESEHFSSQALLAIIGNAIYVNDMDYIKTLSKHRQFSAECCDRVIKFAINEKDKDFIRTLVSSKQYTAEVGLILCKYAKDENDPELMKLLIPNHSVEKPKFPESKDLVKDVVSKPQTLKTTQIPQDNLDLSRPITYFM